MGYLTTFTVYNDGISQVRDLSKEFAEIIYYASGDTQAKEYGLGFHCNLIKAQGTRHASDRTLYVHLGNTVTELNSNSDQTIELAKNNPKFFQSLINYLQSELNFLKQLQSNPSV